MEIIIGKTAGFCFGVKNAVKNTIDELEKDNSKIYCLGELVHNKQVTEDLIAKGAKFINNIEEAKDKVIIRAHGVPKKIYSEAKKLNLDVKDLTCPKVLHIHNIAEEYCKKNYFIFLVGQKDHPESIGTISFCGNNSIIIEDIEQIKDSKNKFYESGLDKAIVIAQTTFSIEKFNKIVKELKKDITNLEVKNTICNATRARQQETEEISKNVDIMIIVGGKHSSNSNKLYEISKQYCNNVFFIETKNELDLNKIKQARKIGIMAGASTPEKSVLDIVDIIEKIC